MGRYRSDDSDDGYSRKSKKKKKRRQRSRSGSDSETSHLSSSRAKKSKKSHRRSRSPDSKRRSRSPSLDKYGSRRKRRSRSRSPERRPRRVTPRSSRSGSRSPLRTSNRRAGRSRTRSPVRRKRSRSRSPSRGERRRTRSRSREKRSRESRSESHSNASPSLVGLSLSDKNPAYIAMTPSEQAEERMRLALKAAAAADQKLKQQAGLDTSGSSSSTMLPAMESTSFSNSVASIESDVFTQAAFKSSRTTKIKEEPMAPPVSHDDAIFGSLAMTGFTIKPDPEVLPEHLDPETIAHPSLFVDQQEKMDHWIQKLWQLRRRKLEGEAMQ